MTKTEKKRKYCVRCTENFYNGYNNMGVKECWFLKSAKVIWRKRVSIHQRPPWDQKAIRVLNCQHERDYVFVGPKQTR